MKSCKGRQLQFINYKTFLAIAWKSFIQVQKLCKEKETIKTNTDNDIDKICLFNAEIQRQSITSILFCTMTLEAFINNYGATKLTKSYFDNYLDKLELKSKWIVIPKLVTGRQINTDTKAYNYLTNLISLRNKLVHTKLLGDSSSEIKSDNWLWETDTFDALECVKLMISELNKIDNEVDINWIEGTKKDPYA